MLVNERDFSTMSFPTSIGHGIFCRRPWRIPLTRATIGMDLGVFLTFPSNVRRVAPSRSVPDPGVDSSLGTETSDYFVSTFGVDHIVHRLLASKTSI
jgi:hypothetical protein